MPLFFQQNIDANTKLAIWKIEEPESFFLQHVPVQREITHPHKRLQHLAGRYLLKHLFPAFPLNLILIANTNKPFLANEAFHFSISHCGDYAAVIVSTEKRVGVDIEIPTKKVLRIVHKFLHEEEQGLLHAMNGTDDTVCKTLLWSAKEAMFKWWGFGNVDFSEMLRVQFTAIDEEGSLPSRFVHPDFTTSFPVHYKIFPQLLLAWVVTN